MWYLQHVVTPVAAVIGILIYRIIRRHSYSVAICELGIPSRVSIAGRVLLQVSSVAIYIRSLRVYFAREIFGTYYVM